MSADTAIGLEEPLQSVASDLPCIGCAYNLRTLAETAVCPECARPVTDSLRFQHLHMADVNWLRRLRRGTVLMAIAVSLMGAVICAILYFSLTQPGGVSEMVIIVLGAPMTVAWACGIWLGTTAEPGAGKDRQSLSRWLNRVLAINSLVLAGVWASLNILSLARPTWVVPYWLATTLELEMCGLIYLCPMMACLHFRAIDRRALRPGLQRINTTIAAVLLTLLITQLPLDVFLPEGIILSAVLLCYAAVFVLGAFGFVGHWRLFTQAMGNRSGRNA